MNFQDEDKEEKEFLKKYPPENIKNNEKKCWCAISNHKNAPKEKQPSRHRYHTEKLLCTAMRPKIE